MSRRSGFTLVELLVVIGVIATLLAILLPALRGVRDRSTSIDCSSRLRELYLAQTQHALENRGKYVGVSNTFSDRWEQRLARYLVKSHNASSAESSRLLHCPSSGDGATGPTTSSYGLNSFVMMPNWRMRRDARYAGSNIILFADKSIQSDDFLTTEDGWYLISPGETGILYRSTGHRAHGAYRHGRSNRLNAVMADGHVEAFAPDRLTRDSGHWYWGDAGSLRQREIAQGMCCP